MWVRVKLRKPAQGGNGWAQLHVGRNVNADVDRGFKVDVRGLNPTFLRLRTVWTNQRTISVGGCRVDELEPWAGC